ncbi:hypothetical protein MNBD_GAMMA01-2074 [hydrothermal vent metagenome]|uniref:Uncharacterized protein n=1 Tax=hydrothermal vent metagenome TaxID=652676 RepID=A0A3B0VM72_9ZZZZ
MQNSIAVSMTLQASDSLNQKLSNVTSSNIQSQNQAISEYLGKEYNYSISDNNSNTLGASGSFLSITNSVSMGFDADLSNSVTSGDILIYDIFTRNQDVINASGAFIDDVIAGNSQLVNGSVTTTQGFVSIGNESGDSMISIDLGEIVVFDTVLVSFAVEVNPIVDGQIIDISNQALLSTSNLGYMLSDDPSVFIEAADVTVIKAYGNPVTVYNEANDGELQQH